MPLVRLNLSELLLITDTNMEALKSRRRRGEIALAFGCSEAVASSRYAPADAVALLLAAALIKSHGAALAGQIVRAFAAAVLATIAEAEANRTDALFAVIDFVDRNGKRAYLACGAHDAASVAPEGYIIERITVVNISQIIRVVRDGAERRGIDLTDAFLPAPDSEAFDAIMSVYSEMPGGIVEARAMRRREIAARKAGAVARQIAMSGVDYRKVVARDQETSATAA